MPSITEETLVDDLREAVPQLGPLIDEHLDTFHEMLPHVLFGEVTQYVIEERSRGNAPAVESVLAFCERALTEGDAYVKQVVAVSFVENVGPFDPAQAQFISTWPPKLRAMAEAQRGWKPK